MFYKLSWVPDTGPGKLTVGKLYGGILIYEIWKTTRFSNLEILAKMEQEMASKMEGAQSAGAGPGAGAGAGAGDKRSSVSGSAARLAEDRESVRTVDTQQMIDISDVPGPMNTEVNVMNSSKIISLDIIYTPT